MNNDDYSAVYTWFEKCGVISNIRTQLRQNLVNALKGNDLSLKGSTKGPKSAKQYIYDLLLAEYLWDHDYVYTLSVFASEAPLLVNFHKHVPGSLNETQGNSKQKLQSDYVCHILETLGIRPSEPEGQCIISEYTNNDVPLLLCILKCIVSFYANKRSNEKIERNKSVRDQFTQANYAVSTDTVQLLIARKKLFQQKDLFNAQLKQKEMELKEQVVLMEQQFVSLNEKLEQAQNLMELVNAKEKQLIEQEKRHAQFVFQKEMELSLKENLLTQEANRLQKERDGYRKFESDLKKLQEELIKVKKELPNAGTNRSIITKNIQTQTNFDNDAIDRGERRLHNQEKQELTSLIREQQSRIEELTLRAVQLSRQLEEANLLKSAIVDVPAPVVRVVNMNTIISESSSTDDILHDAKMRLKRLEEESSKADQYYYNCIITSPINDIHF